MTDVRMPSLDLVREVTDQHVVDQLLTTGMLTRAEIAARTGISKPTVSESVRRLTEGGLLVEAGQQSGGRGRAGTFVRLRPELGVALAISVAPEGLVAQTLDLHGTEVTSTTVAGTGPTSSALLAPQLVAAVAAVAGSQPVMAAAMSLAGPVDRRTGRLVELPDSPFLTGAFDPRTLLGDRIGAPFSIDNDVNWASVAEHRSGAATDLDSFCYLYLGPGLGAGLVVDGEVVRGHAGVAGEISHVRTVGPGGRAMRLVEVFGALALLRPGSGAIDLDRLGSVLTGTSKEDRRTAKRVTRAVSGVIGSLTAVLNPEGVLLGGPWCGTGDIGQRIADLVHADAAVDTEVRLAALGPEAPLVGVRSEAVRLAQQSLVGRSY